MKRILILPALMIVVSCATAPLVLSAVHKIGEAPPLNVMTERSVGDVIYETYNYDLLNGARLLEPANISAIAAHASLPVGEFLVANSQGGQDVYCTRSNAMGPTLSNLLSSVCFVDQNYNGKFDSWKAPEGPPIRRTWNKLPAEIGFAKGTDMAPSGGFRHELVYEGLSGNVVSLLYREYVNDLVRPAFQQEVKYTLESGGGPTEVSFRNTRIRLHSATNNAIKYEILSSTPQNK